MARTTLLSLLGLALATTAACRDGADASDGVSDSSVAPAPAQARRMSSLKVGNATADSDDASQPVAVPTVNGNKRTAPPDAASIAASRNGNGGGQAASVRASSVRATQRTGGNGSTQILNVENASGGSIAQRQSGSGNFQSMNVGVTDNPPAAGAPAR